MHDGAVQRSAILASWTQYHNVFWCLQEQKRVTQVTLAAVAVFVIVGTINLTGAVDRQKLW